MKDRNMNSRKPQPVNPTLPVHPHTTSTIVGHSFRQRLHLRRSPSRVSSPWQARCDGGRPRQPRRTPLGGLL